MEISVPESPEDRVYDQKFTDTVFAPLRQHQQPTSRPTLPTSESRSTRTRARSPSDPASTSGPASDRASVPPSAPSRAGSKRTEPASSSDAPGSGSKPSRRRISHISKACNGCRRRKMKCDGAQPTCAICKVYKEDCVYNPEQDGRRSTPKAYVASLEERIRVLEGMLQTAGVDSNDKNAPLPPADLSAGATPTVDSGLDRLKMDEATGELHEVGPTSLFKHHAADGDGRSPAASLSPGSLGMGSAGDRPAALQPRPSFSPHLGSPELDDATHQEVLRLFFDYFNPQCFWVNEKGFRRDLSTTPTMEGTIIRPRRTAYYSPMLHNVVLSVGVFMLPIDRTVREQLGQAFSKRAKDLIEEEAESAMMSTVSAFMLLGTYHASVARQNLGFVYSGMGLRLVQALGLGTNCSYWVKNGSITEEQQQGRYQLFYAAYVLDKCWSTYVGRGASLLISNHDIPLPEADPEEDDIMWQPIVDLGQHMSSFDPSVGQAALDLSASISSPSLEPIKGWRSTTWVWTCKLAIIAERVLGTVYSIAFNTGSSNVRHVVSDLDVALEKWLDTLPDALRLPNTARGETRIVPSHILNLHALHCFILILLHRPWFARLKPDSPTEVSVAKCERAAHKMVQILQLYRKCPGLRYCPITLNQYAFTAGTVHLLSATHNVDKSSRKAKASIEAVHTCITALEEMGDTLECAVVSASTLCKLLDESNHARLPKPPVPITAPVSNTSIEQLLKDPSVAEQLRKLGWAPPSAPSPAPQPHAPLSPVAGRTPGPRGQGIDFDWFTTPISYQSMGISSSGTAAGPAHPASFVPVPTVPPASVPGHGTMPVPQGQSALGLEGTLPLSEVLYAGAPNSPFPAGNVWTWPFSFDSM